MPATPLWSPASYHSVIRLRRVFELSHLLQQLLMLTAHSINVSRQAGAARSPAEHFAGIESELGSSVWSAVPAARRDLMPSVDRLWATRSVSNRGGSQKQGHAR